MKNLVYRWKRHAHGQNQPGSCKREGTTFKKQGTLKSPQAMIIELIIIGPMKSSTWNKNNLPFCFFTSLFIFLINILCNVS